MYNFIRKFYISIVSAEREAIYIQQNVIGFFSDMSTKLVN